MRGSTHDQQTLPMQLSAMREYVERRDWTVAAEVSEVGSGAKEHQKRAELLKIARRREIDAIVVWRLDCWGRSLVDLVTEPRLAKNMIVRRSLLSIKRSIERKSRSVPITCLGT
jgi:DNA invertase Pin-like site-specific DNA recombinase